MHSDLQDAIDFHQAIVTEGGKALVGYEREKALADMVLLAEIPTTYDQDEQRQVNAGNLLLRGVPGVGKTFFGVILAAISGAKFARLQGRADLQPTEVVGFQMINPATGEFITDSDHSRRRRSFCSTRSIGFRTRLGVYEVSVKVGEGGMGEVYRARDTKLDRNVAVWEV